MPCNILTALAHTINMQSRAQFTMRCIGQITRAKKCIHPMSTQVPLTSQDKPDIIIKEHRQERILDAVPELYGKANKNPILKNTSG
ncbi:hypothetical protein BTUL_0008g00050 [Botrytis tulipae]|uniref:Uncharacterized protein n=1 Tax=Botrytis tulipae TaxID=87230 RepID=A0A4Z1F4Y5_9HELO|nr:hypothetical protein BTUL_0008g00050 [Botrytis tulipae]